MSKKVDGQVIIDVDAQTEKFKSKIGSLSSLAVKSFAALSAAAVGATALVIKSGVEFESAFAGVRKTVDATEEELKQFEKQLISLSTRMPQTASELAGIAEAAGQLGIKNENLMAFTETMAQLGDATNLTSEAAATTLARFANITGMAQTNFDRLGSTIVALGNNMATTEAEIADMGLAIAGAGTQVGLTENQKLALSAALSSVGIEAQAGGTAMSTLMIKMKKATIEGEDALHDFASVANMSANVFKKAFEEDAAGAILKFIQGLATAEERGKNAFNSLDDVGIKEARMIKAMLNLSGASGVLSDALGIANTAWTENTALAKEAAQRYETTESKMKMFQNTLTETGLVAFEKFKTPFKEAIQTGIDGIAELNKELSSGDLGGKVDEIAEAFTDLTKFILDVAIKAIPKFINGMAWVLDNGDEIISIIVGIGTAHLALNAVAKIQALIKAWQLATVAVKAHDAANRIALVAQLGGLTKTQFAIAVLTGKIKLATAAQMAWNAITPTGWLTLAVAGITALAVGLTLAAKKADTFTKAMKENQKATEEAKKKIQELTEAAKEDYSTKVAGIHAAMKYADALQSMMDKNGVLKGDTAEIKALVDQLNGALGESVYQYDVNTGKITDQNGAVLNLKDSVAQLIEMKKADAWLDANKEAYIEALKQQQEATQRNVELTKEYSSIMESESGKVTRRWQVQREQLEQAGASQREINAALEEFVNKNGEVDWIKYDHLNEIFKQMGENNGLMQTNNELISMYETVTKLSAEGDFKGVRMALNGIDPDVINGKTKNLEDLRLKAQELESEIEELNLTSVLGGIIDEGTRDSKIEMLQDIKDKIKEILSESEAEEEGKKILEDFSAGLEGGKGDLTEGTKAVIESVGNDLVSTTETAADSNALAFDGKWGSTLNSQMPVSTVNAFNTAGSALNSAISSFTPNEILIPVRLKGDASLSKYGLNVGGATFDGTSGGSFVNDVHSDLIANSRSVIRSLQSKVGSVILQAKEGNADSSSKVVSINQTNNFNIPVDKPSKISRDFERATKKLASEF